MQLADCWKLCSRRGEGRDEENETKSSLFQRGFQVCQQCQRQWLCTVRVMLTSLLFRTPSSAAISSIWQNFILRIVVYTRWQSDTTQEAFFCHKSQEIRSLPYQKKSLRNKTQKKGENVNFLCLPMCIVLLFTLLQHYHKKYGKNIFILFRTLCLYGFYTE